MLQTFSPGTPPFLRPPSLFWIYYYFFFFLFFGALCNLAVYSCYLVDCCCWCCCVVGPGPSLWKCALLSAAQIWDDDDEIEMEPRNVEEDEQLQRGLGASTAAISLQLFNYKRCVIRLQHLTLVHLTNLELRWLRPVHSLRSTDIQNIKR